MEAEVVEQAVAAGQAALVAAQAAIAGALQEAEATALSLSHEEPLLAWYQAYTAEVNGKSRLAWRDEILKLLEQQTQTDETASAAGSLNKEQLTKAKTAFCDQLKTLKQDPPVIKQLRDQKIQFYRRATAARDKFFRLHDTALQSLLSLESTAISAVSSPRSQGTQTKEAKEKIARYVSGTVPTANEPDYPGEQKKQLDTLKETYETLRGLVKEFVGYSLIQKIQSDLEEQDKNLQGADCWRYRDYDVASILKWFDELNRFLKESGLPEFSVEDDPLEPLQPKMLFQSPRKVETAIIRQALPPPTPEPSAPPVEEAPVLTPSAPPAPRRERRRRPRQPAVRQLALFGFFDPVAMRPTTGIGPRQGYQLTKPGSHPDYSQLLAVSLPAIDDPNQREKNDEALLQTMSSSNGLTLNTQTGPSYTATYRDGRLQVELPFWHAKENTSINNHERIWIGVSEETLAWGYAVLQAFATKLVNTPQNNELLLIGRDTAALALEQALLSAVNAFLRAEGEAEVKSQACMDLASKQENATAVLKSLMRKKFRKSPTDSVDLTACFQRMAKEKQPNMINCLLANRKAPLAAPTRLARCQS